MLFWENFSMLCNSISKKPNTVASELNCSSGSVTAWKNGSMPKWSTLEQISHYFGVDLQSLIFGNIQSSDFMSLNPTEKSILSACRKNSNTLELINLINELDVIDQSEIKGTVKQMLKADKYIMEKENLA